MCRKISPALFLYFLRFLSGRRSREERSLSRTISRLSTRHSVRPTKATRCLCPTACTARYRHGDNVVLMGQEMLKTIIDGSRKGPCVIGADGATITNFTIRNGTTGILCKNTRPTIVRNLIIDNKGAGIHGAGNAARYQQQHHLPERVDGDFPRIEQGDAHVNRSQCHPGKRLLRDLLRSPHRSSYPQQHPHGKQAVRRLHRSTGKEDAYHFQQYIYE